MKPDDLLCSRNARPQKALVGRAQWEPKQATLTKEEKQALKDGSGRGMAAWMVPFARRVRTIRMCSLDARGEGPIQVTLLKNGGRKRYTRRKMTACWPPVLAQRTASEEKEQPGVLLARRTRTVKLCSFYARSEGQPGYSLLGQRLVGTYGGLIDG